MSKINTSLNTPVTSYYGTPKAVQAKVENSKDTQQVSDKGKLLQPLTEIEKDFESVSLKSSEDLEKTISSLKAVLDSDKRYLPTNKIYTKLGQILKDESVEARFKVDTLYLLKTLQDRSKQVLDLGFLTNEFVVKCLKTCDSIDLKNKLLEYSVQLIPEKLESAMIVNSLKAVSELSIADDVIIFLAKKLLKDDVSSETLDLIIKRVSEHPKPETIAAASKIIELSKGKTGIDVGRYEERLKKAKNKESNSYSEIGKKEREVRRESSKPPVQTSGSWYDSDQMKKYGSYVITKHGYHRDQLIDYATEDTIKSTLEKRAKDIKESLPPLFISYNIGGKSTDQERGCSGTHWIALAIIKEKDDTKILIKDSKGLAEAYQSYKNRLKEKIKSALPGNIEFIEHTGKEQEDSNSCGPMSLLNIEIIARGLKKDKGQFIEDFEKSVDFCEQKDAYKNIEEGYKKYLKDIIEKPWKSISLKTKPNDKVKEPIGTLKTTLDLDPDYIPSNLGEIYGKIAEIVKDNNVNIDNKAECLYILKKLLARDNSVKSDQDLLSDLPKIFQNQLNSFNKKKAILGSKKDYINTLKKESESIDKFAEYSLELVGDKVDASLLVKVLESVDKKIVIDKAIDLLLQKPKDNYILSDKTIEKIKTRAESSDSFSKSLKLLTVNGKLDSFPKEKLKIFLDKVTIHRVQNKDVDSILGLCKRLGTDNSDSSLNSVYEILLTADNLKIYEEALEILNSYPKPLKEEIRKTLELEKLCDDPGEELLARISQYVKDSERLSFKCFMAINDCINTNTDTALSIIEEIAKANFQELPNFLIENLKAFVSKPIGSNPKLNKDIIRAGKFLISNSFIQFNDIKGIFTHVKAEGLSDDILELALAALDKREQGFDKSIINDIEDLSKGGNEKAGRILDLLKNSFISILENPRSNLNEREKILDEIKEKKIVSQSVIKLLGKLIKYDKQLRQKAFETLNTVLPIDYEERGLKLDSEIEELIKSFQTIGDRIKSETDPWKEKELQKIKAIIPSDTVDYVSNLKFLADLVGKGYVCTGDTVKSLIKVLEIDNAKAEAKEYATKILLHGANYWQNFDGTIATLLKLAESKPELVSLTSMSGIIGWGLENGLAISRSVIKCLEDLLPTGSTKDIIYPLLIASQNTSFSEKALYICASHLSDNKQDYGTRVAIAKLLGNQVRKTLNYSSIPKKVIEVLKSTVLEEGKENAILRKISFAALERSAKAGELSNEFITKYHELSLRDKTFKEEIKPISTLLHSLNKQISISGTKALRNLYEFSLVKTLSNVNYVDNEMFSNVHPQRWSRNLLKNELLHQASTVGADNELLFVELSDNLRLLEETISKDLDSGLSTEQMFEWLLEKQSLYGLNIAGVNDLVLLASTDDKALKVISNNKSNWFSELKSIRLEKSLNNQGVGYEKKDIDELNRLLSNNIKITDNILSIVPKNAKIDEIIDFFKFCGMHDVSGDISVDLLSLKEGESDIKAWKSLIAEKIIKNNLEEFYPDIDITNEHKKLAKLLDADWELGSIINLVEILKDKGSKDNLKQLIEVASILYEYRIKEYESNNRGETVIDILTSKSLSPNDRQREIHKIAILRSFNGSYDKGLEQLVEEIIRLNEKAGIEYLKGLASDYGKIIEGYKSKSALFLDKRNIQDWTVEDLKEWSKQVKGTKDPKVTRYEKIAVIKRAVELDKKFPPRDIQLLSLLIMLNNSEGKGRLAQINTGEGKTTIVAMLAAIKALEGNTLEGNKVDIITSSSELAKPQTEELRNFYSSLGLTVAHNCVDEQAKKESYGADIVYGAAGDFQGDILRDEYSKLGTRSGRSFGVAIVDEVDSMLIDGKNHIVMLSSSMPGMENLEALLAAIWIQVGGIAGSIEEKDGIAYIKDESNTVDGSGKILPSTEITYYPIEGSKEDFITKSTESHIRKMLRDEDFISKIDKDLPDKDKFSEEYPKIDIPKHLRDFVLQVQLPKWIKSAIQAKYRFEENKHYIIKNKKIMPVDASNTGIVQSNMNWSDGLHQFLQIKHGAKITAESLTTNYISNIEFFKRYKENIYGLTGTLGSAKARNLLSEVYNVDSVVIPPFRQKQYQELPAIITDNKDKWYDNIVQSSLNKLNNGRGALVITRYIEEVDKIKELLEKSGYDKGKIKIYKTGEDANVLNEKLKSGEIIIATNIAGRGTDIKLDNKIEENGGLHVCVTFLPSNERVEQQNVGRTSRTGNKGTAQLVMNTEHLQASDNFNRTRAEIVQLKEIRNKKEEDSLTRAKGEMEKVITKDKIFHEFCKLCGNLSTETNISKAVEERFGIWLKTREKFLEDKTEKKCLEFFNEDFCKKILSNKEKEELIQNPYYHILIGNKLLKDNKYDEAIKEYSRAIKLDRDFAVNGYYNRACAILAKYGEDSGSTGSNIEMAIDDLRQAKSLIEEKLEPMLHIIQKASDGEVLSEQVMHKINLYNIQKSSIENALGLGINYHKNQKDGLEKQLKGIDEQIARTVSELTLLQMAKDKNLEEINRLQEQEKQLKENKNQLNKSIKAIDDIPNKDEIEKGVIGTAKGKGRDIKIEFKPLAESLPEEERGKYNEEIGENISHGFSQTFKLTEIVPIDWASVIGVGLLGLAQVVAGSAIAVFSLGAATSFGIGLITEGVGDLITAVKDGIINRDFSWESWGIQKAISFTVSIVCAGLGALKAAAKTVVAGVKQIGSVVAKGVSASVKEGWKLAAKAIGTSIAKGVAKEITNELVNYGVNKAIMPNIQEEIAKRVKKPIQDFLLSKGNVKQMLEYDIQSGNKTYENLIREEANKILHPDSGNPNPLLTIAEGIAKGVASNKIPGFSALMQTAEVTKALVDLGKFVDEFKEKLGKRIDEIYASNKGDIEKGLAKAREDQQQKDTTSVTQKTKEKQQSSISQTSSAPETSKGDIDLSKGKEKASQIKKDKTESWENSQMRLCSEFSVSVSANMSNIIQQNLIQPATRAAVNWGIGKLTKGIDKSLQEQMAVYDAERRVQFLQSGDKDNRVPKQFKAGLDQIAKGCREEADKIIENLEKDGEAGLPHLGALSDQTGRPIAVYDEKGKWLYTIGDNKKGEPIKAQHHKPTKDNPSGHWTELGGKESPGTGKNNCLFNVVGAQTGKNPAELRQGTVEHMKSNIAKVANQAADIRMLEKFKKDRLAMGGAKNPDLRPTLVYGYAGPRNELLQKLIKEDMEAEEAIRNNPNAMDVDTPYITTIDNFNKREKPTHIPQHDWDKLLKKWDDYKNTHSLAKKYTPKSSTTNLFEGNFNVGNYPMTQHQVRQSCKIGLHFASKIHFEQSNGRYPKVYEELHKDNVVENRSRRITTSEWHHLLKNKSLHNKTTICDSSSMDCT